MSAIAKLMDARTEFHKRQLKKSGWNAYSEYKYLELSDFLIPAMEIFASLKLATLTSFTRELATMTITDLEDNSSVQITSPFGSAALKACHEVQNIGAVESYQRRYLWVAALEIVEHDAIDGSTGPEAPKDDVKPDDKKDERSPVRPNIAGEDLWKNANEEQKEYLNKQLSGIRDFLNADQPKIAAEFFYVKSKMDTEEQAAVWSQLNVKERKSIKDNKVER